MQSHMAKNQEHDNQAKLPYPSVRTYGTRWKVMNILWKILFVVSLIWLFLGNLAISHQIRENTAHVNFRKSATMMEATVIDRYVGEDHYRTFYNLTYRFSVDGYQQPFEKKEEVYDLLHEVYKEGSLITIYYQPDDPSNSMLKAMWNDQRRYNQALTIFSAIVVWVPPLLLVGGRWLLFRRIPRKLRKHGVTTTGTITECRNEENGNRQIIIFAFGVPRSSGGRHLIYGQERFTRFPRKFKDDDPLSIRYLLKKPTVFMLEELTS
jgi:hypothetical protein